MGENRFVKRFLLRRGSRKETFTEYVDNKGQAYDYKWAAKLSSLCNIFFGCLKNGFPIVVRKLWYPAWAMYPFFFVRANLQVEDPIAVLNHERIHIRQQRDIYILLGIPLFVLSFWCPWLLLLAIATPTILYYINWVYVFIKYGKRGSLSSVRFNTCFEREATSRGTNAEYLYHRKFLAVIAYLGIKKFENYGIHTETKRKIKR